MITTNTFISAPLFCFFLIKFCLQLSQGIKLQKAHEANANDVCMNCFKNKCLKISIYMSAVMAEVGILVSHHIM